MRSHVSLSGLRLGGASDDAVSSFSTQGRSCPHLNNSGYVQVPPHSGRNIPISLDRFFLFKSALEVHPFIVGRLHAALFVTFSSSLQPLGFKIIALHRNLLQSLLCTLSTLALICNHERLH